MCEIQANGKNDSRYFDLDMALNTAAALMGRYAVDGSRITNLEVFDADEILVWANGEFVQ